MKPKFSMRQALSDPALLGTILAGDSWLPWRVLLIASMGERLKSSERAIFTKFTGREREPEHPIQEAAYVIGRRGGKDRAAAVTATYIAALRDHSGVLAPGERGLVLCIAADQRQAKVTLDYIAANFEQSPILAPLVTSRTVDSIELRNGITIEVRATSFRRLRGVTAVAVIASEVAFWMDAETSSNPDTEILAAVRPALSTTNGPLILISTPYAKRGVLWETFDRHYGPKGDPSILVVHGTTKDFNPRFPQKTIDLALERDPAANAAEYLAQWRSDLEQYVGREAIEACVERGCYERSPIPGKTYFSFIDPSGGSGQDAMTLAICHLEGDQVVLDCLRSHRPPFNPSDIAAEFIDTLKSYRVSVVHGDRFGGEWCRQPFRDKDIFYKLADRTASDIYRDALPVLNSRKVTLLDNKTLIGQLCALERSTGSAGRDKITHARGAHDDSANAVCGAICLATQKRRRFDTLTAGAGSLPQYYEGDQLIANDWQRKVRLI